MLVSSKGRYALRILTDMASRSEEGYLSLGEMASRQGLSEKYMESIMLLLVRSGILESSRGGMGGYRFRRPPEQISVWDILEVTETGLISASCQKKDAEPCTRATECCNVPLWQGLDNVIHDYLASHSLTDLLTQKPLSDGAQNL